MTLVLTPVLGPARLRAARQALTGARTEEDPAHAAATFVRELAAAYGGRHPRFLQCSYRDALQRAQQESKFLLLYLHSPEHQVRARRLLHERVTRTHAAAPPEHARFLRTDALLGGGDRVRQHPPAAVGRRRAPQRSVPGAPLCSLLNGARELSRAPLHPVFS